MGFADFLFFAKATILFFLNITLRVNVLFKMYISYHKFSFLNITLEQVVKFNQLVFVVILNHKNKQTKTKKDTGKCKLLV